MRIYSNLNETFEITTYIKHWKWEWFKDYSYSTAEFGCKSEWLFIREITPIMSIIKSSTLADCFLAVLDEGRNRNKELTIFLGNAVLILNML